MLYDSALYKYTINIDIDNDSVEDYCCAKFQVIPIRGFRFIVLTYTPRHTYALWQSECNILAAVST